MDHLIYVILIGVGATAVMDLWFLLRKRVLHIPPTDWGLVGRWIAYTSHGKFRHDSIASSAAIRGEHVIGWTAHYVIGISYATLLIMIYGIAWVKNPSIGPALAVGIATVAAPFFILQPGMGAGVAASRSPNPTSVRLQSVLNHAVFGFGMYLSGWAVKYLYSL